MGTPTQIHSTASSALFWIAPDFPSILRAAQFQTTNSLSCAGQMIRGAPRMGSARVVCSAPNELTCGRWAINLHNNGHRGGSDLFSR
jgi:hypothetical protein